MPDYVVRWEIGVQAENPRKAAQEAAQIMQDPASIATVFEVFKQSKRGVSKRPERIDLADRDSN